MNTKKILIVTVTLLLSTTSQAQFWKKVADRAAKSAEETVLKKVDEKASRKAGKTMDTIFDSGTKSKKKTPSKKKPGPIQENEDKTNNGNSMKVKSAKDFIAGNKVIYADTFSNDAIGDFPVTWNTNSSGEIVTFNDDSTKWLQFSGNGQFTPDGITAIPENSTFEFDLHVSENYNFYTSGLYINMVSIADKRKDFTKWSRFSRGENGVVLWLHPVSASGRGRTHMATYVDNSKIIDNSQEFDFFTKTNNTVHVSIWRQKTRLRVYLNDQKIWDLPRAFDNADYNSITFSSGEVKDDAFFYVANLRLAIAGEDKRHALLETGEFETNEILFDVGKASIQAISSTVLNEIGEVLQKNPKLKINIIGHTDSDGQESTNQLLSEARAKIVKEYLTDNFPIMGNRLSTMGKGASIPVASNVSDDGKRKNRRVQFIKVE